MSIKKNPLNTDTKELLGILEDENAVQGQEANYKNDLLRFLTTFQIEPGDFPIRKHTLFSIYKIWSDDPLAKNAFYVDISQYLPLDKKQHNYLVNQSALKITHAAYKYYSNSNYRLKSDAWAKHFKSFLEFHALNPGNYYAHSQIMYKLYKDYCDKLKLKGSAILSIEAFLQFCDLNLQQRKTKHGTYYAITDNFKQFFEPGQLEQLETKYAKENKKKSNQTPRSRSKAKFKN